MAVFQINEAFEAEFTKACRALDAARAAFKRSRTKKNMDAFHAAEEAFEAALAASKAEQARATAAYRRDERAEKLAAKEAKAALQPTFFPMMEAA